MYLEYYGLKTDPFRLSPDSEFFYPSLSHVTAKSYMDYVLWSRDSFILITGEIGTGKTTLIHKMLQEAGHNLTVAKIHQTQLNEVEFLQALLDQFGINPFHTTSKVELLSMINHFLQEKYEEGETVVLVIDEAQNLSNRVLEEIRLLSGFDSSREKILNIFMVGQPELKEKLLSPEMEQLFQRIRLRFHIKGMGFDEVRSYIRHRLAVATGVCLTPRQNTKRPLLDYVSDTSKITLPVDLFSDDLMPVIMRYTGGIPRLINTFCDTNLLIGYANNKSRPYNKVINLTLEDLQWPEYSKRQNYRHKGEEPEQTGATLLVTLHDKIVSIEKIEKESVYVGRSHLCDIVINQRSISSKHFRIIQKNNDYFIEDMNSTNGTFLNSNKITGMHKLRDGDVILIGKYKLTFSTKDTSAEDPIKKMHLITA